MKQKEIKALLEEASGLMFAHSSEAGFRINAIQCELLDAMRKEDPKTADIDHPYCGLLSELFVGAVRSKRPMRYSGCCRCSSRSAVKVSPRQSIGKVSNLQSLVVVSYSHPSQLISVWWFEKGGFTSNKMEHLKFPRRKFMKNLIFAVVLIFSASIAYGQETDTFVVARMGMQNAATYHYLESFQTRGKWIGPDVYYIDFGKNNYREVAIGVGYTPITMKHFTVAEELYLDQSLGSGSGNATFLLPWTYIGYSIPKTKLSGEAVYFPYLPLQKQGRLQQVIERAKLEYDFKHFKLGGGYGAYQYGDGDWQNKPFVTTTVKVGKFGSLEFWLQKMPTGTAQVQIRYATVFKSKHSH
jgi:hypothetical protein